MAQHNGIWPLPYYCDNCSICHRHGCLCGIPQDPIPPIPQQFAIDGQDLLNAQNVINELFGDLAVTPQAVLGFDPTIDLANLNKVRTSELIWHDNIILEMITAAKKGNWRRVFDILSKNSLIINCIPSERAWGVLHQAAWSGKLDVVDKLIAFESCDPFLRTKQDKGDEYGPGRTADELTKDADIRSVIIEAQEKKRKEREALQDKSFISIKNEEDLKVESVFLALASFQKVLYPKSIPNKDSFLYSTLLEDSFTFINVGNQWELARKEVALQLQMIDIATANFLATGNDHGDIFKPNLETKEQFFERVIRIYTKNNSIKSKDSMYNSKPFFSALNKSLRMQGNPVTAVLGEDLALAAFGILLNSVLMFWNQLIPTQVMTYRGLDLPLQVIEEYKLGDSFTWLCFTSSSVKKEATANFAKGGNNVKCIFQILNDNLGKYSSKGISKFSKYPGEEEYLYPSGVKFRVIHSDYDQDMASLTIIREDYYKVQPSTNPF